MKSMFRLSFAVLCVLLIASLSTGGPVKVRYSSTEQFITFLEDVWVNAIIQKDVTVLDRIMADDFSGISPNGYPYTKAEAISDLKSGFYVVNSMTMEHVNVRVYGDMALVTFYQNENSHFGDENSSGRYAFTDVWVKQDGTWRAVSSQGTPVVLP